MFTAFVIYLFSRQVVQFWRQTLPMTCLGRVRKLPGCPTWAPDSADDLSGTSPKTTGFSVWDLQGDTTSTRELGFQGDVSQTFTIGKLSKH